MAKPKTIIIFDYIKALVIKVAKTLIKSGFLLLLMRCLSARKAFDKPILFNTSTLLTIKQKDNIIRRIIKQNNIRLEKTANEIRIDRLRQNFAQPYRSS